MKLTRTLALLVCVLSLFFSSAAHVAAQVTSDWYKANTNAGSNVDKTVRAVVDSVDKGSSSSESYVDDTLVNVQTSGVLFFVGPPLEVPEGETREGASLYTDEEKRILYQRYGRGAIGEVNNAIATLYNPPASSTTYIADVLHSAHIIPQAQAQGLGFSALDPILATWKVFRNIAYLFFVVVFLVIGFMIMFRQKISGQTVVTAQQAIPGVIVSLIFVTFSYAIAGFLIDIMYLLMYLMIGLFAPSGGTEWLDRDIFQVGKDLIIGKNAIFSTVNQAVTEFATAITADLGDAISGTLGWIAGITLALVISVAVFIATFKIFFELLKTYVAVVLTIATAPIFLMLGAIPGQNNFFPWVKRVAGNLLAFPMVLIAFIIYDMFTRNTGAEGGFLPPYLPGRGNANSIVTLVGIGILLVVPELIKETKKFFGADGGFWEQLGGEMVKKTVDAGRNTLQYGFPTARVGGGLVADAYHAYRQRSGAGPGAVLTGFWDLAKVNTPIRAGEGYDQAQAILNFGQNFKPGNLEHLLDSEQRERRKTRRGKVERNLPPITN